MATSKWKRLVVPAVIFLIVGIGALPALARPSTSGGTNRSGLNPEALSTEGFSPSEIKRILTISPLVEKYAAHEGIDPDLINGIIWVESRFQNHLISTAGARGLMQIMPGTQKHLEKLLKLRPGDPFSPQHNIKLGTFYIRRLLESWDGDERLALASYNWGPANVKKNSGNLIEIVESYVNSVQSARKRFSQARQSGKIS